MTPAETGARLLAAKRRKSELPNPFTARDVYGKHWTGVGQREDIEAAFEVLEDAGWVSRSVRQAHGRFRLLPIKQKMALIWH